METWNLGVVRYLNACPLIESLLDRADVNLTFAVPADLPAMLHDGSMDAAMIPVIDYLRCREKLELISDACIGADGETMTVRVFSECAPESVEVLRVDGDSHTSVALAQVVWAGRFRRRPRVCRLEAGQKAGAGEAVLLIGDKVVQQPGPVAAYDLDLGQLWKEWTGLPFVFATWVARKGTALGELPGLLRGARDDGVSRLEAIAGARAAEHGWPIDTAVEYLTERIKYTIGPKYMEGMTLFFELALKLGVVERPGSKIGELVH
jgi:chorismate dehydratase